MVTVFAVPAGEVIAICEEPLAHSATHASQMAIMGRGWRRTAPARRDPATGVVAVGHYARRSGIVTVPTAADPAPKVVAAPNIHQQLLARCALQTGRRDGGTQPRAAEEGAGDALDRFEHRRQPPLGDGLFDEGVATGS